MIMKSCVQWNPIYGWKELRIARSVGQRLIHWADRMEATGMIYHNEQNNQCL